MRFLRNHAELFFRGLWVFFIFLLQLFFLRSWELTSDDVNTLAAAHRYLTSFSWFGPVSSFGVGHLPSVYLLWSLFFRMGDSLRVVQVGILITQAIAHWLLIGTGRRFGSPLVGYLASALFFTNAAFFVQFSQKFWEPAALPLFTMGAFCSLFEWLETKDSKFYYLTIGLLLLSTGGHHNSVFLFSVPLLLAAFQRQRGLLAAGVFVSGLSFLPFFVAANLAPFFVPAVVAGAVIAVLLAGCNFRYLGLILLVAIVGEALFFLVWKMPSDPLRKTASLYGPFFVSIADRVGAAALFPFPILNFILPSFFLIRVGSNFHDSSKFRQALFLWVVIPFLLMGIETIAFHSYLSHWGTFLFPAAWLASADTLFQLYSKKRAFAVLIAGVIGLQVYDSWRLEAHVLRTGGISEHLAILGTKEEVLAKIAESKGKPRIFEMVNPYRMFWFVDYVGWSFLLERNNELSSRATSGKYFYIYHHDDPSSEPNLLSEVKGRAGVMEERIGSVSLFSSEQELEHVGREVVFASPED